ncbi:hypothetical protein [Candidatus Nanohalovita haloferacivicina]|uniref:hypothetical protein n=1 Tax=Candidatus Nanohalovita haloferacivicina TaxID=2978046 RepID=UPI00325F96E3|nr:hypothetical protein HBNXNv_1065 [Candidatus Nanohalobia archaeon BNXNv]
MQEIEQNIENVRRNLSDMDAVSRSTLDGKLNELNKRLEELEVEVFNNEGQEKDLSEQVEAIRAEVDKLESSSTSERINEFERELMDLKQEIDEIKEASGGEEVSDEKLDELWEGLDEEFAQLERRMHDNEQELDELRADVARISEILKTALSRTVG